MHPQFNWDAVSYFRSLVESNKLAAENEMQFFFGSGLQSFEQAVDNFLDTLCFCFVSESADGALSTLNSPNAQRVKTVFLAMRHAENDMNARAKAVDILTEIFRQFMTHIIREREKFNRLGIYLDPVVEFHEFNEYSFSGCTAIYFHIKFTTSVNLMYSADDWN